LHPGKNVEAGFIIKISEINLSARLKVLMDEDKPGPAPI
jgi:hypothetical protein